MTTIVRNELDEVIESEWNYLMSEVDKWSLLQGEQDMEVLEHVLRCILHIGDTNKRAKDFIECTKIQNSDDFHPQKSAPSPNYGKFLRYFSGVCVS